MTTKTLGIRRTLATFATAALLVACGSTTVDDAAGGGAGEGGSGATGAGGSGGTGGSGAGGSGGGGSCDDFANEAPTQAVDVVVRNNGAENIYLSGYSCASVIDLLVKDPQGNERIWRSDGCTFTCAELQEHGSECALDCGIPPVVMLAPGGSYHLSWTGVLFEQVVMPDACYFDQEGIMDSCYQVQVAAAGDYEMLTRAWASAINCTEVDCLCQPDGDGSCQLDFGAMIEGTPVEVGALVTYPTETSVEIVFD